MQRIEINRSRFVLNLIFDEIKNYSLHHELILAT